MGRLFRWLFAPRVYVIRSRQIVAVMQSLSTRSQLTGSDQKPFDVKMGSRVAKT